jgi:Alr-MurF fusion protein
LNINVSYGEICRITKGRFLCGSPNEIVRSISFDTRRIRGGKELLFFALVGDFRNGHAFLKEAYSKGVRMFVVSEEIECELYPNAAFIFVENTLWALQEMAKEHRQQFSFPVIAITGSVGKTMVKEWSYHLLSSKLSIIRSPKSYNSQLGVALSLLELHGECDLALIEVGISKPNEMERMREIVQPTWGVFTAFGSAHRQNFSDIESHLAEKVKLFHGCSKTLFATEIPLTSHQIHTMNGEGITDSILEPFRSILPFKDKANLHNMAFAVRLAEEFGVSPELIRSKIGDPLEIAMRMETFEGINGNTIINDTYNLDFDALTQSLEYQLSVADHRQRVLLIGLDEDMQHRKDEIEKIIAPFHPEKVLYLFSNEDLRESIENSIILIKGSRKADMQKIAKQFRLKNHKTFLEIDLQAVRHNLTVFKEYLQPTTKLLAMVKSNSYGAGTDRMAAFFEQQGIDVLGVAYSDEGVELRNQGITLPILVMNAEEDGFEDCITHSLEPAIYCFAQLDQFIKELIFLGKSDFPIHLKIDTGMARLGFSTSEIGKIAEAIQAQPEVKIKSVYSHLAEADNLESSRFTDFQIALFQTACSELQVHLSYSFDRHILNSEGVSRFPFAQFEMVRLGIGMYGYSSNPALQTKLQAAICWKSSISQLKTRQVGESVGYGRSFIAEKEMQIATVPLGYADGFRRSLSNGKGTVVIGGKACKIVGRVCMDMIMVDVTGLNCKVGAAVEIIGKEQSMEDFSAQMDTLPYEVMTGISRRVHRVYLQD